MSFDDCIFVPLSSLSGLYPARRASRLNVSEALRFE
jgi:ABC-type lipoprotein release transport system permease subunit